jgi:hypothetical protein
VHQVKLGVGVGIGIRHGVLWRLTCDMDQKPGRLPLARELRRPESFDIGMRECTAPLRAVGILTEF